MATTERDISDVDLESFLNYESGSGGGGGKNIVLKNWKPDGKIDVWLHPRVYPVPIWSNSFKRVLTVKEEVVCWSHRWTSLEKDSILKNRFKRDENGQLEFPVSVDPFALLLEWIYQERLSDRLHVSDTIFRFEKSARDVETICVAGFLGCRKEDLTDEELGELRKARIRVADLYKESAFHRQQWVVCLVQDDKPDEGIKIGIETQQLGKSIQVAIRKRLEAAEKKGNKDKGSIFKNPAAFHWEYDEEATQKYTANIESTIELTPEIEQLLNSDPPDTSFYTNIQRPTRIDPKLSQSEKTKFIANEIKNHNKMIARKIKELRELFEAHWCCDDVVPPWDEIFAPSELLYPYVKDEDDSSDEGDEDEPIKPKNYKASAKDEEVPFGSDVEEVECDECKAMMAITEFTCPKCGAEYDQEGKITKHGNTVKAPATRGRRGK